MITPRNPEHSFLIEALHLNPDEFFDEFVKGIDFKPINELLNETIWRLTLRRVNVHDLRNYNTEIVESWDQYVSEHKWRNIGEKSKSIFEFVRKVSRKCLTLQSKEPFFKIDEFEAWQNVTLGCGEDLFVTALLADNRVQEGIEPRHFQWNYIIKSDYFLLNNLIRQKKLVENHYHLGGSSPNVDLSWIYLMNYPFGQTEKFENLEKERATFYPSSYSYMPSHQSKLELLVKIAALIRMWLFEICVLGRRLKKLDEESDDTNNWDKPLPIRKKLELIHRFFNDKVYLSYPDVKESIEVYRYESSFMAFNTKVDYAIRDFKVDGMECNPYIAGERHLAYACLCHIFENHEDMGVQTLFYLYLLIKNHFSHVFIQSNNKTGFQNFKEYNDRKSSFIIHTPYDKMAINMAVEGTIKENYLEQLEVRFTPYATEREMEDMIHWVEENAFIRKSLDHDKYFYVVHFVKEKKANWYENEEYRHAPLCREHEKRAIFRKKAECLVAMRNRGNEACRKIFGIDAASNEVNFRPENLGPVFRYLSASRIADDLPWKTDIPDLRKTYHVGEDFYEVVDGLRAIDEAILFLELAQGDRIGHGVALGINVGKWYAKHPVVALPLQNLVDNLAWTLYKIREWNLDISTANYYNLYTEFEKAFRQLYKNENVDLLTYIKAWELRGDDPECYTSGYDRSWLRPVTSWERHCVRDRKLFEELATNKSVYDLYHKYHFDVDLKRDALKVVPFRFMPFYVDLVKQLQVRMRSYMLEKGVAVESCPTSNYLISNVDEFSEIPTFQLFPIRESHSDYIRLNVSVNTDDRGVFYTSLVKEYTLLAATLRQEKENGLRVHSDDKILNWIEHLINNSKQQCFRNV